MLVHQRYIRVFVSSTFRDMHEEREELVKKVFPQLRKLCEERGVTWGEVDLRWGITDEQKAEGKVLPICCEEINNCRPYFIGILGERYGWIPDEIPQDLIEREPWLAEHHEHSVTELEILHGVLNNPEMTDHAFFYFRVPSYIDSIPPEKQGDFLEKPYPAEIDRYGDTDALRRADSRKRKLQSLKERIRDSGLKVRENYRDPRELGNLVLEDITKDIDMLFPKSSKPDPLDREAFEHEAFAASRTGIYIGRAEYFKQLDSHAKGEEPPLIVLGESGSGKSALLANWAAHYRSLHPDELLLMHFIGSTPDSSDWVLMLRRIMGEMKRRFGIEEDIPDKPDALRSAFANWLHMVSAKGRLILILDALDKLDDRDGAPDLVWLPPVIPGNIRMILSTLPGRPLDNLKERGLPTIQINPLESDESRELIVKYLAQFRKTLNPARVSRIADSFQASNPLYLRTLLEELRVYGDHFTIDQRIDHYLASESIEELYDKVLERWEQDYDQDRPGLVRDSMSLIWGSRRGLSETELLDLLGTDGKSLPRAYWSPLFLSAEHALVNSSGLIDFFHDYLREAIRRRYLLVKENQRDIHLRLADYFESASFSRELEFPWQLSRAEAWDKLYNVLANINFIIKASLHHSKVIEFDLLRYWIDIEQNSHHRMLEAYRQIPEDIPNPLLTFIAGVVHAAGYHLEALSLWGRIAENAANIADIATWATCISYQADILKTFDPSMALSAYIEMEKKCRFIDDKDGLSTALNGQAVIMIDRCNFESAMALLDESELICSDFNKKGGLAAVLGNKAVIFHFLHNSDNAVALIRQQINIFRDLGDMKGLSQAFGNQAAILIEQGDLEGAMVLLKEQENISHDINNQNGLASSLGKQSVILAQQGYPDKALALLRRQELICLNCNNQIGLQTCLHNQASIKIDRGDYDGALQLLKQQECICRTLEHKMGLKTCLNKQEMVFMSIKDHDGVMWSLKEQEHLCEEIGDKKELATILSKQAWIRHSSGDLDGSMSLLIKEEQICRDLGLTEELLSCLGKIALIQFDKGDLNGFIELSKDQGIMCRQLGDKKGLINIAKAIGDLVEILYINGDFDRALLLSNEEESIHRETGNNEGLSIALGNQAAILYSKGDFSMSMLLLKEKERICRQLLNIAGLADALRNQAVILAKDMNKPKDALNIAEEAFLHANNSKIDQLIKQTEQIINFIHLKLSNTGDLC